MLFSPELLVIGEVWFSKGGRIFPDLLLWLLVQYTSKATVPCLLLGRHLKCYFWHWNFLQRVNVITEPRLVVLYPNLHSFLSSFEAAVLYQKSWEQCQGDRHLNNKLYFPESSWAKVQIHANTLQKAQGLKALIKASFRCIHLLAWWNAFCISSSWRNSPDQSK